MLRLFEAHGFRGHLPGLGHNAQAPQAKPNPTCPCTPTPTPNPNPIDHNAQAPLLTKLRGGLRSWQTR